MHERLPTVPVPLRAPDRDATLDLQELLHRVYDIGRYAHYVYESRPQPPLRPDEEAWAAQFLPARP